MTIGNVQLAGLVLVGAIAVLGLILKVYAVPRINRIFRPTINNAIYWFIALLLIQAGFILLGG